MQTSILSKTTSWLRLATAVDSQLQKMQAMYESLCASLSEATVSPETLDKSLCLHIASGILSACAIL